MVHDQCFSLLLHNARKIVSPAAVPHTRNNTSGQTRTYLSGLFSELKNVSCSPGIARATREAFIGRSLATEGTEGYDSDLITIAPSHAPLAAAGQSTASRQTDIAAKGLCFREYARGARCRLPPQVPDERSETDSAMGRLMQTKRGKRKRSASKTLRGTGGDRPGSHSSSPAPSSSPLWTYLAPSSFRIMRVSPSLSLHPQLSIFVSVALPSTSLLPPSYLLSRLLCFLLPRVPSIRPHHSWLRPLSAPRRTLVTGSFPGAPSHRLLLLGAATIPRLRPHPTPSPSPHAFALALHAVPARFPAHIRSLGGLPPPCRVELKARSVGISGRTGEKGAEPARVEETEGKGGIACARPQCTRPACAAADAAVTAGHVLAAFEECWAGALLRGGLAVAGRIRGRGAGVVPAVREDPEGEGGTAAHDHDETHAYDVLAGRVVLLLLCANTCVWEWCAGDRSVWL
ncbi:hypothetical protein DFH08DRAFT_1085328 [Mycena albidolilacea]|uniref:Uncharacterized protein n=1 Tax=Mycena albidolilacea TaxID=1033008 RepID=A0AAD6ZIF6_9AGAR|nr:hypothetical protein DFH08DRAFT_1085328 [Mycena albidolilacea]